MGGYFIVSFPFPLRYLFAAHPQAMGKVLSIVYRAITESLAPYFRDDGLHLPGSAWFVEAAAG